MLPFLRFSLRPGSFSLCVPKRKSKEIVDAFTQNFEKTTLNFSKEIEAKLIDFNKCVESAHIILNDLKSREEVRDND